MRKGTECFRRAGCKLWDSKFHIYYPYRCPIAAKGPYATVLTWIMREGAVEGETQEPPCGTKRSAHNVLATTETPA